MLHFLTIGFFDIPALARAELRPLRPLPAALIELLRGYLDGGAAAPSMEGKPIEVAEAYVRCPWYSPRRNRTAEHFALAALESFGCTVADVEHGRVVSTSELQE